MMNTPYRVVVIGGGITGLAAAWRIQKAFQNPAVQLQLLEASPRVGGSLQSFHREGFLLEMGPDCFISEKPRGIGLCEELGLQQELIGTRPDKRRSFILRGGTYFPVPEGFYLMGPSRLRPFLESGLLSWSGKLRAMAEPLLPARPGADESLGSFVRRRFGQEMLDWMAQPLIAGIYGADPEDLSLRSTFPQFLEMEKIYGSVLLGLKKRRGATQLASGARYSLFMSLRRGMQVLTDTLNTKLGPAVIKTQTRVMEIRQVDGVWNIVKADREVLAADAICLALPSYAAADLVRPFDPQMAADLAGIAYAPAATLNLAFWEKDIARPLDGVGFVVPRRENKLVLGCTLAHNKFDGRVPPGNVLLRAFLGGVHNSWINEGDHILTSRLLDELTNWLGITKPPLFTHLERYERALPQYAVGHLQRILKIEERGLRYKGLSFAGNWSYGVGIPDCIQAGERAADGLITYLKRREPVPS